MRKILVGAVVGLSLIGGQVFAAGASQPLTVGDRVGATAGPTKNLDGEILGVPTFVWVGGILIVTYAAVQIADNDKSSSN